MGHFIIFKLSAEHVPGVVNTVADALSRKRGSCIHCCVTDSGDSSANTHTSTTSCRQAELELQGLDNVVCRLFENEIAQSTRRVYESGQRRYLAFCWQSSLTPLPASESTLCQFAPSLAMEHLSWSGKVIFSCHSALHTFVVESFCKVFTSRNLKLFSLINCKISQNIHLLSSIYI